MSRGTFWHLARKEARALVPTWAAAVAAIVVAELTFRRLGGVTYVCAAFALAAQAVGHEYRYRTLGTLLVQPVDRRRVYAVKLGVLALMLSALAAVAWAVLGETSSPPGWDRPLVIALPALGALLFAPWMTMLCRSPLAGTLFSAVPLGTVFVGAQWLADQIHGSDHAAAAGLVRQLWFGAMAVMAPAAAVLGWRRFITLEVVEGDGPVIQLPQLFKRATIGGSRHHLWQAVVKEVHLQQITLVTVALFVAWSIWGLIQVSRGAVDIEVVTVLITIYLAATALLIGSLASAEERQLGTHELELMLPVPAWQKWTVKVTVAMTLSVLLAAVLPVLVLSFAPVEVTRRMFLSDAIVAVLVVTAIGIFVSSLSTSGVSALATAAPAAMGAFYFAQSVATVANASSAHPAIASGFGSMGSVALVVLLVTALLWLGFVNHRAIDRRPGRVAQQVAGLLAVIALGVVLT